MSLTDENMAFAVGLSFGMIAVAMRTESMENFWLGVGFLVFVGMVMLFRFVKAHEGEDNE